MQTMGILRNSSTPNRSPSDSCKDESQQDNSVIMIRCQQEFEAKREEFRKYLERVGVIDALTKVLVLLYQETEKPDDAAGYICKNLGGIVEETEEVQTLKKDLEAAKAQIAELEAKLMKFELEDASA